MLLRMTQTRAGSLNGRDVRTYTQGETYTLPDQGPGGLPDVFLREGWAELVEPEGESAATGLEAADAPASSAGSDSSSDASPAPRRCQAVTRAGAQCQRDAAPGSDYCITAAHAKLAAA